MSYVQRNNTAMKDGLFSELDLAYNISALFQVFSILVFQLIFLFLTVSDYKIYQIIIHPTDWHVDKSIESSCQNLVLFS